MDEATLVYNEGGVPYVGGGPLADRPAPGVPGRLYFSAEPAVYRDSGVQWHPVGASEGAASILAKLLAVDGAGSGLDADTLDGVEGAGYQPAGSYAPGSHVGAGGVAQHPAATGSTAGFLSSSDKTKLDGLAPGGGSPDASTTVRGLVELATTAELQSGAAGILVATAADVKAELDRRFAPEAWIAPTLTNGWVNYGGSWDTAGYRKDPFGRVHLKGHVRNGASAATAFVLPAGYRPAQNKAFSVLRTQNLSGRLDVLATGEVQITVGSDTGFASLEGVSFSA